MTHSLGDMLGSFHHKMEDQPPKKVLIRSVHVVNQCDLRPAVKK